MKHSQRMAGGLLGGLVGLAILAAPVHAQPISRQQAEDALTAAFAAAGQRRTIKVHEVAVCVPAFAEPRGTWACMVDHELAPPGRRITTGYLFRQRGGPWSATIDPPVFGGACPPGDMAQDTFRATRKDPGLSVTGVLDDGEGQFQDDRGVVRRQKGPMRLMCTYEVRTGAGGELSFLAYVYHDGNRYIIEPDWDVVE